MTTSMITLHPTLSRTLSATSISSDDTTASTGTNTRRTRKRFNSAQLVMLEQLYHQSSHPTRAERDAVAKAGGMENRSVTIWFQNKRQTERRVALNNATNNHAANASTKTRTSRKRRASSPFTSSSSSRSSRPSLDRIASRSELWAPPPPRTPTRPSSRRYSYYADEDDSFDNEQPSKNIWDNMPSSPAAPPFSPPARDYVEFGRTHKRTLEWACAAARLAEKDGLKQRREEEDDDTDVEIHEAITPPSTLGAGDRKWDAFIGSGRTLKSLDVGHVRTMSKQEEDQEEVMKAALALCGLGGGRMH